MNNEDLASRLKIMKNVILSLQEQIAPELKTKDLAFLKYGFTSNEIIELDRYLFELTMNNKTKPNKKEFKQKLAEIKGLPELSNEVVQDILEGYKADGLHLTVINNLLNK